MGRSRNAIWVAAARITALGRGRNKSSLIPQPIPLDDSRLSRQSLSRDYPLEGSITGHKFTAIQVPETSFGFCEAGSLSDRGTSARSGPGIRNHLVPKYQFHVLEARFG